MTDVITIGEPLFEFNALHIGALETVTDFRRGFGGDTSNVAIAAARMGAKVEYICRIGSDAFGLQFLQLWQAEGVGTKNVIVDETNPTGIYFISRDGEGHHFAYYRRHSAASFLSPQDIPKMAIQNAKLLHVSGISQAISNSACDAIFHAIEMAKSAGVTVTYDPNLRLKLWDIGRARAIILETIRLSDVVLAGFDEMQTILNLTQPRLIISELLKLGAKTVILKLSSKGVMFTSGEDICQLEPLTVQLKDATGAGDTFDGVFCATFAQGHPIEKCVRFANIAAGLSVTKPGAVDAIPTLDEVEQILSLKDG